MGRSTQSTSWIFVNSRTGFRAIEERFYGRTARIFRGGVIRPVLIRPTSTPPGQDGDWSAGRGRRLR